MVLGADGNYQTSFGASALNTGEMNVAERSRYHSQYTRSPKTDTVQLGCTDGRNDGQISPKEKAVNFVKGVIAPFTEMVKSPKNLLIGAGTIAGCALLTAATGGAILPVFVATGLIGGGITLGVNAYRAAQATTDAEAKQAWQGIGTGTFITTASLAGAKTAARTAGLDGCEKAGMLKSAIQCVKQAPKALGKSVKSFTSGAFIGNLKAAFVKPAAETAENTAKPEAEAPEAKAPAEAKVPEAQTGNKLTPDEIQAEAKRRNAAEQARYEATKRENKYINRQKNPSGGKSAKKSAELLAINAEAKRRNAVEAARYQAAKLANKEVNAMKHPSGKSAELSAEVFKNWFNGTSQV